MSSKTKIVVLHLKELIYTGIFVVLGILFIILLFIMFRSDQDKETQKEPAAPQTEDENASPTYQPGVYKSAVYLDGETVEIDLRVDENEIVSLTMQPPSDTISSLYPLLEPSFNTLSAQICENQSLKDVTYAQEAAYTSRLLLEVIENTLEKAQATP